jgi:hypothetical protein
MFVTWFSSFVAAVELYLNGTTYALYAALWIIAVGSFVTAARRLVMIYHEVEAAPWPEQQK